MVEPKLIVRFALFLTAGASLCLLPVEPAQGQSLQRLFSTPGLRAELDRRRARLAQGQPAVEVIQAAPVLPVVTMEEIEVFYQLGGVVSRSDGSYTVWLNNQPYAPAGLPENMELLAPYGQGRLRILNPESGASYVIVPGQVLNLATGDIQESYMRSSLSGSAPAAERQSDLAAAVNSARDGDSPVEPPQPDQEQANPQ
ncbi:MAG: hypothetical protein RL120_18255 [Gammaproteobacteria bacterium]